MSAAPKIRFTVEEYLARERKADYKSEFYQGEIFAMAGASAAHNEVKDALVAALRNALRDGPCRTASSDQRVLVDRTGLYTYPDIVITCEKPIYDEKDAETLTNPTVIIEILSPSTEKYDRGAKFRNYQQIPSLKEYILVAQDEAVVERFVRQSDGSWALTAMVGLKDSLQLASRPARIPLADIYYGIDFPPQAK
jgi:Uma2 family endonuclease